jgi:hypothetical protein
MAGYKAFQEKMMGVNLLDDAEFSDADARRMRYAILSAMYENTVYSKMHRFSQKYKSDYGLYRATRNIYNPSYRIGEFWKHHLLGGKLDPAAGDGSTVPSALPIETTNEAIRPALALLWRWSNWQIQKDILGLWTPVMGDGVLKVVDDPERKRVYLKPVSASKLTSADVDSAGNVKGYVIEERRDDPRTSRKGSRVTYREEASRDGDMVVYKTFLDNKPYDWYENGTEWTEDYGFIPMVLIQHNNVGLPWGWSELYPGLSKFREVDDLASKLSDQVRKMVDSPWLFSGVTKASSTPKATGETPTADNPKPEREEIPIFYGPVGTEAKPLVSDLKIADAAGYINDILAEIERDYPELSADMHNVEGDISGRALRINRGPAEEKVLQRRPNYDDAIVRAQMMALSIGGMRGYEGFQSFNEDSYLAGELDHTIGERPVFSKDELDDLERDKEFWTVAKEAKAFGIPPLVFLEQQGWPKDKIDAIEKSPEYQARMAAMEAATEAARNPQQTPPTNRFARNNEQ